MNNDKVFFTVCWLLWLAAVVVYLWAVIHR